MTKIMLTGASGFVGKWLTPKLRSEGFEVYELHRPTSRNMNVFLDPHNVAGDVIDYTRIDDVVKQLMPDIIIHLAALTPVRFSWMYPFLYEYVNFNGTVNLVDSAKKHLSQVKFVFASTAEVYGTQPKDQVVKETGALNPVSPYARSKMKAEKYVSEIIRDGALIFRCNNTYGRPYSGYFVETVMEQLLETQSERTAKAALYNPEHKRDYMFITDHVSAYLHGLKQGLQGTFNVAQGEPISNIDMLRLMAETIGIDVNITVKEPDFPRPADQASINQDTSKLRGTGWKPQLTRAEGIKALRDLYEP